MDGRHPPASSLGALAPGAELFAALSAQDPARTSGRDTVAVLGGWFRLLNHVSAQVLAWTRECALVVDPETTERAVEVDEFGADEARAALGWSRARAGRELELADALATRLPAVAAAMATGALEQRKAEAFSRGTADVSPEVARSVCGRLLPEAPGLTLGALIARIARETVEADPSAADRRAAAAAQRARVIASRSRAGTASISGLDLPVDRAVVAVAAVERAAAAARRAGVAAGIDRLRAEVYLGFLDGRFAGLDVDTVVAVLAGQFGLTPETPTDERSGPDDGAGAEPDPASGPSPDDPPAPAGDGAGASGPAVRDGRWEVRAQLATLLGLEHRPGELVGWGPLPPAQLRHLVATTAGARWLVALTDAEGHLLDEGLLRAHPASVSSNPEVSRRATVEIAVPVALLPELSPEDHPEWAPVIRELRRHAERLPDSDPDRGPDPAAASRRRPGAALARRVRARDRRCVAPACHARATDLDHTHDWARGGPTTAANLGAVCHHDNRLKTEGRWRLHQDGAGHFTWTSRAGATYRSEPPPVIPAAPPAAPVAGEVRLEPVHLAADRGDPTGATSTAWTRHPDTYPQPPPARERPPPPADDPAPF